MNPKPLDAWEREALAKDWGSPLWRAWCAARGAAFEAVHALRCAEQRAMVGGPRSNLSPEAAQALSLVQNGNPHAYNIVRWRGGALLAEVDRELAYRRVDELRLAAKAACDEAERLGREVDEERRGGRRVR